MSVLSAYFYESRYRLLKWIWNVCSVNSKIHVLTLMYHHVSDAVSDSSDCCHHSLRQFKFSIESLIDQGYVFVPIEKILETTWLSDGRKYAVITFDDVPYDAYKNAVPFLVEKNLPFTMFITTGFVGMDGYMTQEQIKEVDSLDLCTIGAHTMSHPNLRYSDDPIYEMVSSKEYLEDLLDHSVEILAYPYGRQSSVSRKVIACARRAGFKCAFGTVEAPISDVSIRSKFYLPRVVRKLENDETIQ